MKIPKIVVEKLWFKIFSVVIGEQNGVIGARVGVALVPLQPFFVHWNGLWIYKGSPLQATVGGPSSVPTALLATMPLCGCTNAGEIKAAFPLAVPCVVSSDHSCKEFEIG